MANKPHILVGVGGGIAAYKALDVVSALKKKGAVVTVLLSRNAHHFVAPLSLKVLSGRPVGQDLFEEPAEWGVGHVSLAKEADAFVIVAATADLLAKLALGIADDFVSTCGLVYHPKPLLLAPAMNTAMLRHPTVRQNLETLISRGARVLDPSAGLLACGDIGDGKLVDAAVIADAAWAQASHASLSAAQGGLPLKGKRILISAGPTREHLDPVRFISNPSSGKMGFAVAAACRDLGAEVTLVSGPVSLAAPEGVQVVRVTTAVQMLAACDKAFDACDAFIASAAVSDFRPAVTSDQKKKKKDGARETLQLVPNPDVLLTLSKRKGKKLLVGSAAETE
ncbi:MAG TPA: bifunctional phosphopantothenoylcysteine decarboxylase/phosphopantothenate--cysteine ligase CoaBC, partial [bacterium]|nr:bifunctional phosphopantothenoylcysteine decarboxylase/phosphopantothenate--cysteine ligase CoaBC [bacterium]